MSIIHKLGVDIYVCTSVCLCVKYVRVYIQNHGQPLPKRLLCLKYNQFLLHFISLPQILPIRGIVGFNKHLFRFRYESIWMSVLEECSEISNLYFFCDDAFLGFQHLSSNDILHPHKEIFPRCQGRRCLSSLTILCREV